MAIENAAEPLCAQLEGVSRRFGKTVALQDVSIDIRRGELLAILGPNGAGKSTSIALLLGLHQPDCGRATLFGRPPGEIDSRRRVGIMMQEANLPPDIRVRELIHLVSSYYPDPLPVRDVLDLTQTGPLASRPYAALSGGQKRLAQFAAAICGRPQLLFLDEPTAGLDIQARERLWATLRTLVAHGTSIVLTTHYLEEAEALANRVVVLARGRMVATGTVNEIRALVARKKISCVTSLSADEIRAIAGVQSVHQDREQMCISVREAEPAVLELLMRDRSLRDLEIHRAGLAEAVAELTEGAAS